MSQSRGNILVLETLLMIFLFTYKIIFTAPVGPVQNVTLYCNKQLIKLRPNQTFTIKIKSFDTSIFYITCIILVVNTIEFCMH